MATLKGLRLKRFLSQEDLAEKSGVAAVTINRLENDKQKPTFKTIRKLAAALGVEPGQIEFPGSSESPPVQERPAEAEASPEREGQLRRKRPQKGKAS